MRHLRCWNYPVGLFPFAHVGTSLTSSSCASEVERVLAKVLVVEDETLISMWVEEALREAGHDVFSALNADRAIAILESDSEFDIVFTDIDMPGSMDGLKLAAYVRNRWPPVHLIIASGKHRPRLDEMPTESVFLPKPYLPNDVIDAIQRVG